MNKLIKNYINIAIAVSLGLGTHTAFAVQTCKTSIIASTPDSDFIDNQDGTVTHKTTGLMWKKCSEGFELSGTNCLPVTGAAAKKNWKQALEAANSATFAGHSDWRLPNIIELGSIVEVACHSPAINLAIFPNTISDFYWSSSPNADNYNDAWGVYFSNGGYDFIGKDGKRRVRLVRVRSQ